MRIIKDDKNVVLEMSDEEIDSLDEATKKVIRGGEVTKVKVKTHKKRLSADQLAALRKLHSKPKNAAAIKAWKKSMKLRSKKGLSDSADQTPAVGESLNESYVDGLNLFITQDFDWDIGTDVYSLREGYIIEVTDDDESDTVAYATIYDDSDGIVAEDVEVDESLIEQGISEGLFVMIDDTMDGEEGLEVPEEGKKKEDKTPVIESVNRLHYIMTSKRGGNGNV
jgi:hypothetical protein